MNTVVFLILILGCFLIVVFGFPWYIKQLGRFFCRGIVEHFNESLNVKLDKMYDDFQQIKKEN